jgi:hypothetical protein
LVTLGRRGGARARIALVSEGARARDRIYWASSEDKALGGSWGEDEAGPIRKGFHFRGVNTRTVTMTIK